MARKNQERRTQKTKPIEIGLMTADSAILYYFNEVIRPVVDNGDTLENVPVLYANPERWASIQKEIVIVANIDLWEIWDKAKYKAFMKGDWDGFEIGRAHV